MRAIAPVRRAFVPRTSIAGASIPRASIPRASILRASIPRGSLLKTAAVPALLAALTLAACGTPARDPGTASAAPQPITTDAMLPPDNAPGQTTAAETPAPETAANMGPGAAAAPAQPVGLTQALPGSASRNLQMTPRAAMSDSHFAQQVISDSATEIALARIALLRAHSEEVRSFARRMLVEHRRMAIELDDFGLQRGFMVNWRMSQVGESLITRLRAMPDAQFDSAYVNEMLRAHEEAVALLEAQAAGSSETASLARAALPTIRAHLAMVRDLQQRV